MRNNFNEEWRVFPENDNYAISNMGKVKRIIANRKGIKINRILKPGLNVWGRQCLILCKNGKTKPYTIHRLVARTFIGERPKGYEINHIDGNKVNNCIDNLEYVTPKENMRHARKTKLIDDEGEKSSNSKLKEKDIFNIFQLYCKTSLNVTDIAKIYGISTSQISRILTGKKWKHLKLPFIFKRLSYRKNKVNLDNYKLIQKVTA